MLRARWLVVAFGAALSGCHGCSGKPYTPFGVASALPSASASADAAPSASASEPGFAPKPAVLAPHDATRWLLGASTIEAPKGRVFERAVQADFDGDGKPDVVAWTLPKKASPAASPGELWYFPSQGAPKELTALPGFVPTGPACKLETELAQTGDRSLTLDADAHCTSALIPRSPTRALAVIEPAASHPVRLVLRVAEAAPGETMKLAVDSSDRDGDGQDDVALTLSVRAGASHATARAELVWFARPAGLSLEASEPVHSFERLAARALFYAKRHRERRRVAGEVNAARRLFAALCKEGGEPRVLGGDGAPFSCRRVAGALGRLAEAKALAALEQDDVLEATSVLTRDGWYGFKLPKKNRDRIQRAIEHAVSSVAISNVVHVKATPEPRGAAPRWSPLEFEASGSLIVQTASGLVRVAADGSSEAALDAEAGAAAWPLAVTPPGGAPWTGVTEACDRPEVLLTFGATGSPLPTRLLAPRPGACEGGAAPRVPAPAPVGVSGGKLEALVAGSLVGPHDFGAESMLPVANGSPRSPDGKLLVAPTALGLLVLGTDKRKPELWTASGVDPLGLSDCTVANGARAVACMARERVLLFVR
jgi:hypothetical protein